MSNILSQRVVIVGSPGEHHVGAHLLSAARAFGLEVSLVNLEKSQSQNIWVNRLCRRVLQKRPAHLNSFSNGLVTLCRETRPDLLLVTGIAAPHYRALKEIGNLGIRRVNFVTDDPWNRANAAGFFWKALQEYDIIYTPRRANIEDLKKHGCLRVEYLPFGYNPLLHFSEKPTTIAEHERFSCDVAVVGGADTDRLPMARALVGAGLNVHLYGGYWDKDAELRPHWRGLVFNREMRLAVSGAKVNLCFGRKANRDGHAMRSFELPAMSATIVAEGTGEHRDIFGERDKCVCFYDDLTAMTAHVKRLCHTPEIAHAMGQQVFERIVKRGSNSYSDRLLTILDYNK